MVDANQPALVLIAAFCSLIGGVLNVVVGFLFLSVCYGVIVIPIGLWQLLVGAMALTGRRVPTHLLSAGAGLVGAMITFDAPAMVVCAAAVVLLALEMGYPARR